MLPATLWTFYIFKYCEFETKVVLGHVCKGLQNMTHLVALSVDPAYYNTTAAAQVTWNSSYLNCKYSKRWETIINRIKPLALRLKGWSDESIKRVVACNPLVHTLSLVGSPNLLTLYCHRMPNLKNLSVIGGRHNIMSLPIGLRMLYVDGIHFNGDALGEWIEVHRERSCHIGISTHSRSAN
jgi:hypothetical protein